MIINRNYGVNVKKFKLFMENFIVYGIGGVISKIIPLIMLPIVTRLMPNSSYFGISDMSNTIISFASAFAIMGMYDAMYRTFFDKQDEKFKKNVCSTALMFTIVTSFIVFILLILLKKPLSNLFFGNQLYTYVIYIVAIATLTSATNSIISAPTRMQNKKGTFLLINTLSPVLSYTIAIPLLLNRQYVIALPLATAISGITIEILFAIINKQWFSIKNVDFKLLKKMLIIAVPLFPNFLIYWIFNSCDKVMITNILGVAEQGVYSIGSKLGQVSQLIYLAFAGGWQYFAFSTMNEKNQVKSNSLVFEYLGLVSFIATIFVCVFSQLIINILFTKEYLDAFIVAPYLFFAPLLQMLFQVAANQFLIIKKTWPNLFLLLSGAVINIILNMFLIPKIGIEGASIATLTGYIVSVVITVLVLIKMKLMVISKRFIISTIIVVSFFLVWRFVTINLILVNLFLLVLVVCLYGYLYRSEMKKVILMIKKVIKKNK